MNLPHKQQDCSDVNRLSWVNGLEAIFALVKAAEDLKVPWGSWRQDHLLLFIFGGEVSEYSPESLPHQVHDSEPVYETIGPIDLDEADRFVLSAPKRLVLRRFISNEMKTQEEDRWEGWGKKGSIWRPDISIVYQRERGVGVIVKRAHKSSDRLWSSLSKRSVQSLSSVPAMIFCNSSSWSDSSPGSAV